MIKKAFSLCIAATCRPGAWDEGSVIFFDDSFEHTVINDCDQVRVVFQVVFLHPDLWTTLQADPTRDIRQIAGFEKRGHQA